MNINIQGQKVNKLWIIVLLGMLTAIGPLSMNMYLPALPIVSEDLDTSASLAQLSLTACLIGLVVGQLLFGPLSDIKGRKSPFLYILAIYAMESCLSFYPVRRAIGSLDLSASRIRRSKKRLERYINMPPLVNFTVWQQTLPR